MTEDNGRESSISEKELLNGCRAVATWRVQLNVDCPYCDAWQDIMSQNAEQDWMSNIGETKDFKINSEDVEYSDFTVRCEKCDKIFAIRRTEY